PPTTTATDTATGSSNGVQSGITVNAPPPLLVAGYPSPTIAGASHTFTVTAKNANGSNNTAYRGTVHFTSTDTAATLPANYIFTSTDNGVHTFSATLRTVGTRSITATDTVTGSTAGTQSGITVNQGTVSKFVVTGYPSTTNAGDAHSFTVTATDSSGNVITNYAGTVHFTSNDTQSTAGNGLPA